MEAKTAYELWAIFSGALESGVVAQEDLQRIVQDIQKFFKSLSCTDGVDLTERCLLKWNEATVVDFDTIRAYLHEFWKRLEQERDQIGI